MAGAPAVLSADWELVDWSAHVRDAVVGAHSVRYVDVGAGPVLLLVHGLGGSWQSWLDNIASLAAGHRVVAVDLPGFGASPELPAPQSLPQQVEVLAGLLDALGLADAVVVGHSMGGLVSLLLATSHPDCVRGLVLVDAGGVALSRARLAAIVGGFRAFHAILGRPGVLGTVARRPLLRRALLTFPLANWRSLSPALAAEIVPLMLAPGFLPAVRAAALAVGTVRPEDVACPALVLWGGADRILPPDVGRALTAALPRADMTIVSGTGHCPMFEQPGTFNATVGAWLADLDAGRVSGTHEVRTVPGAEPPRTQPRWARAGRAPRRRGRP